VRHVDLTTSLQARVDHDGLYTVYIEEDLHWTSIGHAVAADAIYAFLVDEILIP